MFLCILTKTENDVPEDLHHLEEFRKDESGHTEENVDGLNACWRQEVEDAV